MIKSEYDKIVMENFNILDETTRKTMIYVNESDRNQILTALANRLYTKIVKNVYDIDFGTIPNTKGDITKMENYNDIKETLDIIRSLLVYYNQPTSNVDIVLSAIDNVKTLNRLWEKGYAIECGMVVILYETMCLSIVGTTSLLISGSIEYIKDPNEGNFDITLKKASKNKSSSALMLRNIDSFNKACSRGDIERTCKDLLSANKATHEAAVLAEAEQCLNESIFVGVGTTLFPGLPAVVIGASSIAIVLTCIIPFLRELTSTLVNAKQSFSDYLSMEADLVRLNAERIQYSVAKNEETKKKIKAKQLKIADRLKKMSEILLVKMTKASKIAEADVKKDSEEKLNITDIVDELPDSVASLF